MPPHRGHLPQVEQPASLAELARTAIERAILAGTYLPGERLVEERLCEHLGISRPPLREALRQLSFTGIVEHTPRKGVRVMAMTQHDVYEILTFRRELERMALRLALPGLDPGRLDECRAALERMWPVAEAGDEGGLVAAGFEFHLSVIRLAHHKRIEQAFRSMSLQLQLCMAMNNRVRRDVEDLKGNVQRHEELLAVIVTEDRDRIEAAFDAHGNATFVRASLDELEGGSNQSAKWFAGFLDRH
ncbi:GntR family transcriptional regulator [Sediminivirga luteola]|nr:GntR family transcriptional regulator [Sediminivirga luteola]MCI2266403.1 GntR family transcriptional regulator [Sediminivirga luteola]